MPLTAADLEPAFATLAADVAAGQVSMAALAVGDARGTIAKAVLSAPGGPAVDVESLFFLASVTKPIFATALMQLAEEGRLALDDPIAGHMPEFATPGKELVTTRHLLGHTSGLQDVTPEVIRRTRPSAARMTQLSLQAPLQFVPGTRWQYTSSSFYVLAELARRLTGQSVGAFLDERIFAPLAMHDTGFDPRRRGRPIVPVRGVGAENRLMRFLLLRYVVSIAHPGGGLWGTLDDVVRFGAGVLAPRREGERWMPLSPPTIALMGGDHARGLPGMFDGEERPVHFGLAWGKSTLMRDVPGSPRVMDHGGATGTRLWIDPQAGLVFVYFTNEWRPNRGPEVNALRAVYAALDRD